MSTEPLQQASQFLLDEQHSYVECCRWMRNASNIRAIAQALDVTPSRGRIFISMLFMHRERSVMLDDNDALDRVMGRIARGMVERVTRGDSLRVMREATLRAETMMNYW